MQMPQLLHKLLKTRRNKDIFLFLLFFVLAALLWYGHAMQSVRTTRVPVYIQYTGKPGNIGLTKEGLPNQVMITVRDAGHRLNNYHTHPPQITIDLHQYIHGDSGTILIPSNDLRASIKAVLQDNSNLLSTSPDEIRCGYFKEHEKTVVLVFAGTVTPSDGYQKIGQPRLFRQRINIYGQEEVLKTIDTIRTEAVVFSNLTDTLRTRVALNIPKGVRAEIDSVHMESPIEQFTEKHFSVPVQVHNVPGGCHIHLFPATVDVNIRIGISHFDDIKESDLKVYCDFPTGPKAKLDVHFDYPRNPHITSTWYYPTEVEYLLEE